ncbi:MAG: TIGR03545 family protein [Sulfurimonadaceae bacterium]
MEFFKKIFKALNSAQHPWQVTLSIALGMVAGLTPLSGTQTLLILFIVFLLNIHIGLFFAASALFAGIAYLFDPLMEQFGYALLTNEGMKELYTAWYNNGIMRLSHFNNTLMMGATVISLLLALPLFFVLNFIIALYRDKIAAYLNANKWFARLGIFKVKDKKEPVFRWWGAGLYLAVVGGLAVVLLLVIDPLLEWGIEKGASKALQKDVRVASVETHLLEGYVAINTIEVASEKQDTDAFSIAHIGFDLDMNALLFSKTHIESMQLKGIGFDTKATMKKAYGKAAFKEQTEAEKKAEEAEEKSSVEMPSIDLPTPRELLAKSDLKSQKLYEEAKAELTTLEAKWKRVQKEQLSKEVLEQYKKELKQMEADAKSKDAKKLLALAKQVKEYKKKLEAQKKALQALKTEYLADQKRLKTLLAAVKSAPQEDYAKLRSTYSLDSSGGINLFGLLFSQKIAGYLHQARGYYAQVEPYLQSDEVAPEEIPPRGKGRWVRFPQYVPTPDLWIARTALSGERNAQTVEGVIKDISDNQKALGRALTFSVKSDGPLVRGLKLEGEDNRLGEEVVDTLLFSAQAIEMKRLDLKKMKIDNSKIGFNGQMTLQGGTALVGSSKVAFRESEITLEGVSGKGAEIMNDMLKEIREFGANVAVDGNWKAPSIRVSSDIDQKLSKAFKQVMAKEITKYKKELKLLLDQQLKEQLGELGEMTSGFVDTEKLIDQESLSLDALENKAKELVSSDSNKKLAEDKAKDYLKDEKNKDKLKKLFKF